MDTLFTLKEKIKDLQIKKDGGYATLAELDTLVELQKEVAVIESTPPIGKPDTSLAAQIAGLQAEADALKASILSSVAGLTAKIVAIQQHLNQVRDVEPLGKADAQAMDKLKLTLAGIDPHMPQTV
jgi:hypothetical protein